MSGSPNFFQHPDFNNDKFSSYSLGVGPLLVRAYRNFLDQSFRQYSISSLGSCDSSVWENLIKEAIEGVEPRILVPRLSVKVSDCKLAQCANYGAKICGLIELNDSSGRFWMFNGSMIYPIENGPVMIAAVQDVDLHDGGVRMVFRPLYSATAFEEELSQIHGKNQNDIANNPRFIPMRLATQIARQFPDPEGDLVEPEFECRTMSPDYLVMEFVVNSTHGKLHAHFDPVHAEMVTHFE